MSDTVIRVENLGKKYRLGLTHDGSIREMANRWTRRLLRRPDPAPVGHTAAFSTVGNGLPGGANGSTTVPDRPGEFWALRDVSFEVKQGEVLGIIGRNGAGKSTLLKILSQITRPTTGRVEIHGRVASLLEVGTGFHPELTGRENVYLNGTLLGLTRADVRRKFDEIVEFSGVEKFIDTPVKRYSSGMKVRLGFAVAAHLEPEVLIVDEVLAVGDAEFQRRCLGKLEDVANSGRTVLFVSHNMAAVETLCSAAVLLDGGQLELHDACGQVLSRYLNDLTSQSNVDISLRKDREGDGSARCTAIWFETPDHERTAAALSGRPLRICLRYVLNQPHAAFRFNLGIYDTSGICLAHNTTYCTAPPPDPPPDEGTAVCEIPRLPLPAGTYYINTSILRDGKYRADRVERAASLTVDAGDYYGTGKLPTAASGKVLLDYDWQFNANPVTVPSV